MTATTTTTSDIPARLRTLPRWGGYVVPFFVEWLKDGKASSCKVEGARPDFRVISRFAFVQCVKFRRCWICGQSMGSFAAFVVGPMCTVNRLSSEPPSHRECAEYAAQVCPHLGNPDHVRREANFPGEKVEAPGVMLKHNPGASAVWITRTWEVDASNTGNAGLLFKIGDPIEVQWWAKGRRATRDEVVDAFESGLPHLFKLCANGDDAALVKSLASEAMRWVPTS